MYSLVPTSSSRIICNFINIAFCVLVSSLPPLRKEKFTTVILLIILLQFCQKVKRKKQTMYTFIKSVARAGEKLTLVAGDRASQLSLWS